MGFWQVYMGIYGGGTASVSIPSYAITWRGTLIGQSAERLTLTGQSNQRGSLIGQSNERQTLTGYDS